MIDYQTVTKQIIIYIDLNVNHQEKLILQFSKDSLLKQYDYSTTNSQNQLSFQYLKIKLQLFGQFSIIYLKKQNIVHRDISLDNILVDKNMNIKITDFGIASDLKGDKYYQTEKSMGKDSYRAPEVWKKKVSMNSDLWALGIIILELYLGDKINKLYKSKPGDREQFPSEFYEMMKVKIPQEIMRIVKPLLERDHNIRKFYDGDEQDDEDDGEDRLIIFKHIKTDKKITKKMTQLELYNNNIGTEGAVGIAKNLKNLTKLYLYNNNIGAEGAVEIAKNLKNLTVLWLDDNNIGTEGAVEIVKNLKNLRQLYLYNNKIDEQVKKMIKSLRKDKHVSV